MKNLIILITLNVLFSFSINSKEISLTFDDSPRFATGYFDGPSRAKKLIENLKSHNIQQVAFFSVSKRLDDEGQKRLKMYNDAGHLIANHTHSHGDINTLTLEQYSSDFLQAHDLLNHYSHFVKMFRYPYLREGDTLAKRDGMRSLLAKNGYINAYITLNNYDWYIESLFQKALKDGIEIDFKLMSQFYVDILIEGIEYYDNMAIKYLGRSPKHVLLLHEMDITALFIGDLIDELRHRGWKIISPSDAYKDPISDYKTELLMRFNPGRIGEIAKDKNQTKGLWHETLEESYLDKRFNDEVLKTKQIVE